MKTKLIKRLLLAFFAGVFIAPLPLMCFVDVRFILISPLTGLTGAAGIVLTLLISENP